MLILSPTWSTGINIENEFDLIVGDYARNTNIPLTEEEIYQALIEKEIRNISSFKYLAEIWA